MLARLKLIFFAIKCPLFSTMRKLNPLLIFLLFLLSDATARLRTRRRVCMKGQQLCGSLCFDSSSYSCHESSHGRKFLCNVHELSCGDKCYDPYEQICSGSGSSSEDEVLCPVDQRNCGKSCYNPKTHRCSFNTVYKLPSSVSSQSSSYGSGIKNQNQNSDSYSSFGSNYFGTPKKEATTLTLDRHAESEGHSSCASYQLSCGGNCYDPTKHVCYPAPTGRESGWGLVCLRGQKRCGNLCYNPYQEACTSDQNHDQNQEYSSGYTNYGSYHSPPKKQSSSARCPWGHLVCEGRCYNPSEETCFEDSSSSSDGWGLSKSFAKVSIPIRNSYSGDYSFSSGISDNNYVYIKAPKRNSFSDNNNNNNNQGLVYLKEPKHSNNFREDSNTQRIIYIKNPKRTNSFDENSNNRGIVSNTFSEDRNNNNNEGIIYIKNPKRTNSFDENNNRGIVSNTFSEDRNSNNNNEGIIYIKNPKRTNSFNEDRNSNNQGIVYIKNPNRFKQSNSGSSSSSGSGFSILQSISSPSSSSSDSSSFGNVVSICRPGKLKCGNRCYDPRKEDCYEQGQNQSLQKMSQNVKCNSGQETCGFVCYDPFNQKCLSDGSNGKIVCKWNEKACGKICLDSFSQSCRN